MIPYSMLAGYLGRQRWYAGTGAPGTLTVIDRWAENGGSPGLARLLVDTGDAAYQLVLGVRPAAQRPDWLRGHDEAVVGEVEAAEVADLGLAGGADRFVVYDAVFDPELAARMLVQAVPDERASRVRVMGGEQSNTSLVFDERLILKVFRRLFPGPNPEVEMTSALAAQGFDWVAAPLGTHESGDFDLAIVQPFLIGGVDGWALALTSLRDLFGLHDTQQMPVLDAKAPPPPSDPAQAGGDFSAEARRLGETTAAMHAAIADSLGREPGNAAAWADDVDADVRALHHSEVDERRAAAIVAALRDADPGVALRVHGDFHLGQVMRTDAGWYVLDFEGEPARPVEERRRRSSPLRDVAGMLRSFHYAASVACGERDAASQDVGVAWEARNRRAFLEGYLPRASDAGILPGDEASVEALLDAFELEKAAYELGYEKAYRPEWEAIPLQALRRLTRR